MKGVRTRPAQSVDRAIAAGLDRSLAELAAWLRIPSVSTDPARAADCRRAAEWLGTRLRHLGCGVSLVGSPTHPVVVGHGPRVRGAPTVVVYGHYDVQPPDPLEAWVTPPFQPTRRRGAIHARGATDDKGQVLAVIAGYEAAKRTCPRLPINIRFLVEGQEESGGAVMARLLQKRPALVKADVVLVADAAYPAPGWPAVEVGVRGLCYAEITVRTLRSDLHSGLFGGVAPNAHETLVRILAGLKYPSGRLRIPGLLGPVRRPGARERRDWGRLPLDPHAFLRNEVGARALVGPSHRSVRDRLWAMPTCDIHGITGGFTGPGVKTVIPAVARAKVSLRLVPNQRHHDAFVQLRRAVLRLAPPYATVTCHLLSGTDPVLIDASHPAFARLDEAFRDVEGRRVIVIRSGGSLPIVAALGNQGAAVVLTGIGLPTDGPHAPNEKLSIRQFQTGIRVFARFFSSLQRGGSR